MMVLLVDGLALCYAAQHSSGHLQTSTGIPTGMLFQFLRSVRATERDCSCSRTVIAWDTPGPIEKAQGVSFYKANRPRTDLSKRVYEQLPAMKEVLALTRWHQVEQPGYEADDLIAAIAEKLTKGKTHKGLIFSPDDDLLQLVDDNVSVVRRDHKGKGLVFFTKDQVVEKYGVRPAALPYWRSVVGDVSDNLPRVKLSIDEYEEFKQIIGTFTDEELRTKYAEVTLKLRDFFGETLKAQDFLRNFGVMRLSVPKDMRVIPGKSSKEDLTRKFQELEMKSLMKRVEEFC